MNRSLPAILGLAALVSITAPRSADAQVLDLPEGGQHAVVVGNTLWDLAAFFYGDPFQWPRIYEANVDRIEDPHWIYPGQLLLIPDEDGNVQEVRVVSGEPDRPQRPQQQPGATLVYREPERTVFFRDTAQVQAAVQASLASWLAVPSSIFYSAPFIDYTNAGQALGEIVDFEGEEEIRTPRDWMVLYDRVVLDMKGDMPAPGTRLQVFDLMDPREGMEGLVAIPTGVLTILHRSPEGVVASVDAQYSRMRTGDFVRALPTYPGEPGVVAEAIEDGPQASVVAYADPVELHQPGHYFFLDLGRSDGVGVGDEFIVELGQEEARVEGRAQVVGVQDEVSTARIMMIRNPVFTEDAQLRQSHRMPRR
jgi:hypothetical protein